MGAPEEMEVPKFGFQLKFAKTEIILEKETLLYEFESFVSEFGGALGLFLGFSFSASWDALVMIITNVSYQKW